MSASGTEIAVAALLAKIDAGERILLLDVRNDEEFERWRVEGREPVATMHRPYFDFIEDETLLGEVPRDAGEVFVICAKGDSSDLIAQMLRDRGVAARNVAGGMVAYGESLLPARLPLDPDEAESFEIWQMNRRGKGCLSYVIRSGPEAVVVDPSRNLAEYERFVASRDAKIIAVFDTHVHADHVSGGPRLAPRHGARYFVAGGPGVPLHQRVDPLRDGEEVRIGGARGVTLSVRILSTPGHTPGSTSFLIGRRHLLTGDTIFVESVGRPDLGGQVVEWGAMLFRTLRERIATLPDDTVILPAHYGSPAEIGPDGVVSALLGDLRRTLPEMQIGSEPEFIEAMKRAVKPPPPAYETIVRVNLGLQSLDEETATEWELGKNECAASARRRMEANG